MITFYSEKLQIIVHSFVCPYINFQPEATPTTSEPGVSSSATEGASNSSGQAGDVSDPNCLVAVEVSEKVEPKIGPGQSNSSGKTLYIIFR